MKEILVDAVMSTDCILGKVGQTMAVIARKIDEHHIQHLPILDDNDHVVGIISKYDIELLKHWGTRNNLSVSNASNKQVFNSLLVEERMSKDVKFVSSGDTLEKCAILFRDHYIHALPVLKENKLVGIITTFDLLKTAYL